MHSAVEKELAAIEADKEDGAAQLAARSLDLLAEAASLEEELPADKYLEGIAALVRRLGTLRPSMASLGNWALIFYEELQNRLRNDPNADRPGAARSINITLREKQSAALKELVEFARPLLARAEAILTLSYSSTVEAVLLGAAASSLVRVAEARPLLEGRKLFSRLREGGVSARLVTDAQMAGAMAASDLLLLGADTICADLSAVNKTGSRLAALAAREFRKPCVVATDTFKIAAMVLSENISLEEGPGEEVWEEEAPHCENRVFEVLPPHLIGSYLTEKGVLSPGRMEKEIESWRARAGGLSHSCVPPLSPGDAVWRRPP